MYNIKSIDHYKFTHSTMTHIKTSIIFGKVVLKKAFTILAPLLLNLFNSLQKIHKMLDQPRILSLSPTLLIHFDKWELI